MKICRFVIVFFLIVSIFYSESAYSAKSPIPHGVYENREAKMRWEVGESQIKMGEHKIYSYGVVDNKSIWISGSSADHFYMKQVLKYKWFWDGRFISGKTLDGKTVLLNAVGLTKVEPIKADKSAVKSLSIGPDNANELEHLDLYSNLTELKISGLKDLKALPDSLLLLKNLETLEIVSGKAIAMNIELPAKLYQLENLTKLVLNGAQNPKNRKSLKRPVFPNEFSRLKNLEYLDLGHNKLNEIPAFVGKLSQLRELHLPFNEIDSIPLFVANLRSLLTIDVSGNNLRDVPNYFKGMNRLRLVTLGNNCTLTKSKKKMEEIRARFPKIDFEFEDRFDCP